MNSSMTIQPTATTSLESTPSLRSQPCKYHDVKMERVDISARSHTVYWFLQIRQVPGSGWRRSLRHPWSKPVYERFRCGGWNPPAGLTWTTSMPSTEPVFWTTTVTLKSSLILMLDGVTVRFELNTISVWTFDRTIAECRNALFEAGVAHSVTETPQWHWRV